MKKLLTLFTVLFVCIFLFIPTSLYANTVTINDPQPGDPTVTTYLPIAINTGTGANCAYHSVSQQLYYASELLTASSTTITAITFYYESGTSFTRKLRVWLKNTELSNFSTPGNTSTPNMVAPGTKVFSGDVALTSGSPYTITFNTPFVWDGESNIIVTVLDSTGLKNNTTNYGASAAQGQTTMFGTPNAVRFLHKTNSTYADYANAGWTMDNLASAIANSSTVANRKYVNKITFTFADALPAPATPSDLTVNATTANSALLAWSSVTGAASYDLQQSNNGSDWSELASGETETSFEWSGLEAGSTHYVRIRANNASGSSEWSDAVSFTTDAVHTHDGITFDKWNSTNDIPLSGNYYLAADVTITSLGLKEISGSVNLCLNGHTISFTHSSGGIQINNSASLTIFDNIGGGFITSPNGTATIQVNSGGRLTLHGGSIRNSASNPPVHLSDNTSILSLDMTDGAANEELLALANGHKTNVHINRSFTSASYNTICLPFELKNSDLESVFGSGYSLASLSNSTFDGSTIELEFSTSSTTLYAGKPYLIQPAHDVSVPTFNNVTVSAASLSPVTTEFVDFIGVFSPTVVGSGENVLFLSENNELKWNSNASGALKGFRAYFEVKGAAQAAVRARIVQQAEDTEAVINTSAGTKSQKVIRDGQLYLMFEGRMYNVQGQRIQ